MPQQAGLLRPSRPPFPSAWWDRGTGITAFAGCATPPSRSWHSYIWDTKTKLGCGETGSFAPSPAARIKCRLCTASAESAGCLNWSSPGSLVIENSSPVRIGNAAAQQLQIDVFGEVGDALFQARKAGMKPSERVYAIRSVVLEHLAAAWRQPDEGIWEVRGQPQHFVHSKVMAWVAFDRAANDVDAEVNSRQRWRTIANEIHAEICQHGFDSELNSFVQAYGSRRLDASLLLLPLIGFLPPDEPRMRGTLRAIEERLLTQEEFVLRYESEYEIDGLPAGEGAFFACGFWLVDNYVLHGRYEEARRLFERLLSRCNDVGLLAEEFDPQTGRMLGNFPQAYCHVGIINCALNLSRQKGPAEGRSKPSEREASTEAPRLSQ